LSLTVSGYKSLSARQKAETKTDRGGVSAENGLNIANKTHTSNKYLIIILNTC